MKRFFVLVLVLLVSISIGAVAQDSVLIDFSELTANYPPDDPRNNEATLVDFSIVAGTSFSEEDRAGMMTSLAIENWDVVLSSSSRTATRQANSIVRQAMVREGAVRFENEAVMGVRVMFPTEPYNAWALITPPFEIPAYADLDEIQNDGTLAVPQDEEGRGRKFDNVGVVKNVGVLRSVHVWVHGLNHPYGFSIVLEDETARRQEIFMGYLNFDGWRELIWENPNYIEQVRHREVRQIPLYPQLAPMRRLVGIRVYRDASQRGGDFVSYVKDIRLTYDLAVLDVERDIDDEAVWGILQEREAARRRAELQRLGNLQILRFLEERRMYPGPEEQQ